MNVMRRRWIQGLAAAAFVLAGVATSGTSHAYCRSTNDVDFVPTATKPCDLVGKPLYWRGGCIGFSVQKDASVQVSLATATTLVQRAFDTWAGAGCVSDVVACTGGVVGKPSIAGRDLGPVECGEVRFNQTGANQNVVVFRDGSWPHAGVVLALTTTTFVASTGEIFGSDLEVSSNPAETKITTSDTGVVYDLASILQHETGHFLGLGHSTRSEATMFASYKAGQTFMRDLAADDACAICAAYPPSRSATCDPTPMGGFATDCAGKVEKGCGCSIPGSPVGQSGLAFGLVAFAIGIYRRRSKTFRAGSSRLHRP